MSSETPQTTPTSRPNPNELVRQLVGLTAEERAVFVAAYLEAGDLDHILQAVPRLAAPELQGARERLTLLLAAPAGIAPAQERPAEVPLAETSETRTKKGR